MSDEFENEELEEKVEKEEGAKVEEVVEEVVAEETIEKEKKKFNFKLLISILVILVVAIGIWLAFNFGLIKINNKIGNSIGNIRNYGYATAQGNKIYYISPSEGAEKISIYKCNKNGSNIETLLTEKLELYSLNVLGDYLYFIGINVSDEEYSEEDYLDNKIYKMKTNGKDLQVINDNEFNNDSYEIYVVKDKIYYIGIDNNIYFMDLNGENKKVINDDATGFIGINDKYILLNKKEAIDSEEGTTEKIVTYSMNLDGTNKKVVTGERLYSVNLIDDDIYYVNENKEVYKANIQTGENTFISKTSAYNMNVCGDYIYFMNYTDESGSKIGIYKMKLDGTKESLVIELDSYSNFLDVVMKDKIIYMDSNDTEGVVNMIDAKKMQKSNLFTYKFDFDESYEEVEDTSEADTTN